MTSEKIKKFVLNLLDESFYELPVSVSHTVKLTKAFFPKSEEHEVEAVIDELVEEGSLILGLTYGYERGITSAKKAIAKKPLVLQPIALAT